MCPVNPWEGSHAEQTGLSPGVRLSLPRPETASIPWSPSAWEARLFSVAFSFNHWLYSARGAGVGAGVPTPHCCVSFPGHRAHFAPGPSSCSSCLWLTLSLVSGFEHVHTL